MNINNSVIRVLIDTVVLPYLVREDTWDKVEESIDGLLAQARDCLMEFVEHASTAATLPSDEQLPDDVNEAFQRRTKPGIAEQNMGESPEFYYVIDLDDPSLRFEPS